MTNFHRNFNKFSASLQQLRPMVDKGKVINVSGQLVTGFLPNAAIGSIVSIGHENQNIMAEVIGFSDKKVLMLALDSVFGLQQGVPIRLEKLEPTVSVGHRLLGRVIDARGEPLDGKGPISTQHDEPLYKESQNPMARVPISEVMDLGVRSLNSFTTTGCGQRMAILAGSGVGKSVLLGMLAQGSSSDINVISLIGERGREVKEFIEENLGPEGLARSVVVVATSDQSAILKVRSAFYATAIAEYFSQKGQSVLLMMDSVTRFAMAQREIGLLRNEPPTTKGYTPSVFSQLPKLLERPGRFSDGRGSITGLYTVLIEGDDLDDPIGDTVRSIVDGHIFLDRDLANRGIFPAVNILNSHSRLMSHLISKADMEVAILARRLISTYKDAEDLIQVGAYKEGSDETIDQAIRVYPRFLEFLRQNYDESVPFEKSFKDLRAILELENE